MKVNEGWVTIALGLVVLLFGLGYDFEPLVWIGAVAAAVGVIQLQVAARRRAARK